MERNGFGVEFDQVTPAWKDASGALMVMRKRKRNGKTDTSGLAAISADRLHNLQKKKQVKPGNL
ncbi:hypothetical protein [Variovorax saccharolyticus]|uniref:hypothetical protein n=1 Tax=Variovorax saccharolyticus TaxID=3053516 RepID=UPI00257708C4|nr:MULTISPECIES: hypothetical protein [unclassified Variovorax]MDM0022358.1 hypothetical protein [Variovorax sp. J22R187]MDM0029013.1 hypothetical protein [Variovorax sp. J31P216]